MKTEHLVSQLVLAAEWDFADDHTAPVKAAASLLGISETDPRLAETTRRVAEASGLSWAEQVGLAAHLLLVRQQAPLAAAA